MTSKQNTQHPASQSLENAQKNHPRIFLDNKYVYPVISRRAGGVSIGVNLNLDKNCNFDCPYCQVDRRAPSPRGDISIRAIQQELEQMLSYFQVDGTCTLPMYQDIPPANKKLRDISLSGDGEPTMLPEFPEVCALLREIQQRKEFPFSLNLITNATLIQKTSVLQGIQYLMEEKGEVWAKLDAGTQEWYNKVNISNISLDKIESNLITAGKVVPLTIQTLFFKLGAESPSQEEIQAYCQRLKRVLQQGAFLTKVLLYTIARNPADPKCTPLSPEVLLEIQETIQSETGLFVQVS
jgi:wyosine [tRNA(Phe)-imidazoG37] synthetase (radical SAM superfamily)